MQSKHLLLSLFALFGLGLASPLGAQERSLNLRATSAVQRGDSHGSHQRSDYARGRGRRTGVDFRIGFGRHAHVCVLRSTWVPGHYESVPHSVYVPGRREKIWIDPIYEDRFDACGQRTRVLVQGGGWKVIEHPGHYETRFEQVWVSGRHERRLCCAH